MDPQKKSFELEESAARLADAAVDKIVSFPGDYAQHQRILYDLKTELTDLGAVVCAGTGERADACGNTLPDELRWRLAGDMPGFSTEALYQKRSSLLSMGGIVFFGYLLGGLLSTVLGWLDMGGDIIRVVAVWAMFYASEYLSANPKARLRVLAFLGLGTLAGFAVGLMSGMLRLTSWAGIKRAVFGSGETAPGLLKRWYLLLGAAFLFVFLSKKVTALDVTAFKHSLQKQAAERMRCLLVFFEELNRRDAELAELKNSRSPDLSSVKCPKNDCLLARDVIQMLDAFDADTRTFLAEKLAAVGYETDSGQDDFLVWNGAEHEKFYDMVGLVRDGDRCRILKRCYMAGEKIVRGYVQRDAGEQGSSRE
ncbi:adenosine deaminase [Desulfovibrio sp. PG-178-WT-4]|uniref:Adenosine deaminase n=1 Tax=Desulfovibrio porci TaxID=2605782 RepID=A0A6L5XM21_9BACT|nr:adenosine deaminase [Desulfovibrio porci]MSS28333.1 adenosine deaminase [Desulfovibrio porci]